MDRRAFIGSAVCGLLAPPLAVRAQQAGKIYRIGILEHPYRDASDDVKGAEHS